MILFVVYMIFSGFFWVMTAATLRGVDWILISGPNLMPKEDRLKFKEKHDMVGMNRYIGRRVLLPITIWSVVSAPSIFMRAVLALEAPEPTVYIALITICTLFVMVSVFSALPKIWGNRFEKP